MAVNYTTAVKTARMAAVAAQADAGAGPAKLEIGTAGMAAILAVFTLNDPCGTAAAAALTLSGFPKTATGEAAAGADPGTLAVAARIRDSNNVDIVTGLTVGTSGADVVLTSAYVTSGQTVTLNSAVITHAT